MTRDTQTITAPPEDARVAAERAVDDVVTYDRIRDLLEQIFEQTKNQRAEIVCRHCHRTATYYIPTPDVPKIVTSLKDLLAEAKGRPGTADGTGGGVTLIIEGDWSGSSDQEQLSPAA